MTALWFLFGGFCVFLIVHGLRLLVRAVDDERTRTDMLEWRIFREHMERTR